ncbi:hypothetical protein BASA81_010789 [Batrachochytrium salamandrivorans]|nr:hypothetical protein BASA81_010789 [Batrachochytrium salamandrivorans]
MGCAQSSLEDEQNAKISKAQIQAKRDKNMVVSLMLVGSGDSGKSTLLKQLAHINTPKFQSPDYRQTFTTTMYRNLYDGVFAIVEAHPEAVSASDLDLLKQTSASNLLPRRSAVIMGDLIKQHPSVLTNTPNLQDCFHYFIQNLCTAVEQKMKEGGEGEFDATVVGGEGFIPSVEDCVRCRVRTSGIIKQDFYISGTRFSLMDVGGQRAERRKWIHKFEDVSAIIFVCAASEYDLGMFEDPSKNRLEDSLELFGQVVTSEFLKHKPVLLYLNKKDLLVGKLKEVGLNVSGRFPGAPQGPPTELSAAVRWLTTEFEKKRNSAGRRANGDVCACNVAPRTRTTFSKCLMQARPPSSSRSSKLLASCNLSSPYVALWSGVVAPTPTQAEGNRSLDYKMRLMQLLLLVLGFALAILLVSYYAVTSHPIFSLVGFGVSSSQPSTLFLRSDFPLGLPQGNTTFVGLHSTTLTHVVCLLCPLSVDADELLVTIQTDWKALSLARTGTS